MKKFLAIILAIFMGLSMLAFTGCTNTADDDYEDYEDYEDEEEDDWASVDPEPDSWGDDDDDAVDKGGDGSDPDEEFKLKAKVNKKYFDYLGKTPGQMEKELGAMSESYWVDGPWYHFGDCELWFAFSEYDFAEDNSYIPLGVCNTVNVSMGEFLMNIDDCNLDDLAAALGVTFKQEEDLMDGGYSFSADYDGNHIVLYADSKEAINRDTSVKIVRK